MYNPDNLILNIIDLVNECKIRPSWDEYFISTALLVSIRSPCERLHVGCVVVLDNRIVSTGYNGFLPGAAHVSRMQDGHEQATVHAEQNAITDAAKRGVPVAGGTMYVTHFPCVNCAKIVAAAGIKKIIYVADYRNDDLVHTILTDANVLIERFEEWIA